jgi:putative transposase
MCQFSLEPVSQRDGRLERSRFSDEQIIGILKEQEAGAVTADVCRHHEISEATFFTSNAKFGDLKVTEAKRLRNAGGGERQAEEAFGRGDAGHCGLERHLLKKW